MESSPLSSFSPLTWPFVGLPIFKHSHFLVFHQVPPPETRGTMAGAALNHQGTFSWAVFQCCWSAPDRCESTRDGLSMLEGQIYFQLQIVGPNHWVPKPLGFSDVFHTGSTDCLPYVYR